MQILQRLPHFGGFQGSIEGHLLCEPTSLRNQQTEVLDDIGLRPVLRDLLPTGQDLPIPTFSDPVLLVLTQRRELQLLQMVGVALLGPGKSLRPTSSLLGSLDLGLEFAELWIAKHLFLEVGG